MHPLISFIKTVRVDLRALSDLPVVRVSLAPMDYPEPRDQWEKRANRPHPLNDEPNQREVVECVHQDRKDHPDGLDHLEHSENM